MVRLIEALNYRCLRYIRQPLADFQVLVGPNASGKTTFLDVISFLGDLVSVGLEEAVRKRTTDFQDLVFMHESDRFELAVEMEIPEDLRLLLPYKAVRYGVSIGWMEQENEAHILDEKVILKDKIEDTCTQRDSFPQPIQPPDTLMTGKVKRGHRTIISKTSEGNDNYRPEDGEQGNFLFRLGPTKSSLGNLPADKTRFPISTWLRDLLRDGVEQIMLNSKALRQSSPPGQGLSFHSDGSNLPWVLDRLKEDDPGRYAEWIEHVRTALPDMKDVRSIDLPDTRHRYLKIIYDNGMDVPSWTESDGTLRLLALTLPAYLPDFKGIYLIEEPENGVHPMAMETVFQSLKSVYSAQILMATHSPVVLGQAQPRDVLCFKKDSAGATDIVRGDEHPKLENWQGSVNLADLYASGVLG